MENKVYKIRVYIPSEEIGLLMNDAVDSKAFKLINSYDGMNGMLAIYDENLLSGYNILCNREDCGTQMADVEFLNQ